MNSVQLFPKIQVGSDEFADLIIHSDVFVDKSLMIKELLEDSGKVMLITRPRRWGKSLNMNMIGKFFAIEVDDRGDPLAETERVNHKLFLGGKVDLKLTTGRKKFLKALKIALNPAIIEDYQGKVPMILLNQ